MDELRDLAQQGEALSWMDFEGYLYENVGSGCTSANMKSMMTTMY
ncbi:hypothetical protein [Paenibacillus sp. FSL R5-0923]